MDEVLEKQILRQLKIIKILLGFFASLIIIFMLLVGYGAYRAYQFGKNVDSKIQQFENSMTSVTDVNRIKNDICSNSYLRNVLGERCDDRR